MGKGDEKRPAGGRITPLFVLRFLRLSLGVLGLLILLVLIGGTVLWIAKSPLVARYISRTLNERLMDDGYRVMIRDIMGSPFETIILEDISIGSDDGDTLLACESIQIRYPLLDIIRGRISLDLLEVTRPRVALARDSGGQIIVPWRAGESESGTRSDRRYVIDRLSIKDLDLSLEDADGVPQAIVDDLSFQGHLTLDAGAPHLVAERVWGRVPVASVSVDSVGAVATLREGRIFFGQLGGRFGGTRFVGEGVVSVEGPPVLVFDLDLPVLETSDVWPIVDLSGILGDGRLSGGARVQQVDDGFRLEWDLAGVLSGDPIERLAGAGTLNSREFRMSRADLRSGPQRITGSARFELVEPRRYEADIRVRDVDLTDVPVHEELVALHPHRISGRIRLEGNDYERLFPSMVIRGELGPSTYATVPFDSLFTLITLIPGDIVRVHDSVAFLGGGVVYGKAEILPEKHVEASVTGKAVPIERFVSLHGVNDLAGLAEIDAQIEGDILSPDFTGIGRIKDLSVGDLDVARIEVDTLSGVLDPFSISLSATGEEAVFSGRRFATMHVTGTFDDTLAVDRFTATGGDTAIVASGTIWADPPWTRGRIETLEAELPIGPITLQAPMPVARRDDGLATMGPGSFLLAGGRLDVSLDTDPGGKLPQWRLIGEEIPIFDLISLPLDDVPTGAICDVDVEYQDHPEWPWLVGSGHVRGVRLGDITADSLRVHVAAGGDSIVLSELRLDIGPGSTDVVARVSGADSPLKTLTAPGGWAGFVESNRRVELDLEAQALDMGLAQKIRALLNHGDEQPEDERTAILPEARFAESQDFLESLGGRLSATLKVVGSLDRPEVRLDAFADSVKIRGQELDRLELEAVYRDSLLTLSRCDAVAEGHVAQVTGLFPCRVEIGEPAIEPIEKEMQFSVDLAETPLSLLSAMIPDFIVTSGRFTGRGGVSGTPSDPVLIGDFTLNDGEFRWAGRHETFQNAVARLHLRERGILLTEFTADQRGSSSGKIRCTGHWEGSAEYRFQVSLKDCRFFEGGIITGVVDGNLNVSPDSVTVGQTMPRIDGLLDFKFGEIYGWGTSRPERGPEERDALYDVTLDVGRINVRTSDVQTSTNFVIGDGDLTVRNYPEDLLVGGSLQILEGTWTVLNNRFRITHGVLTFPQVPGVNPDLDIVAETPISGPYARERGYEGADARIILTIGGNLQSPTFNWSTEPMALELSQDEILSYLAYGRYAAGSGAESGAAQWTAPTTEFVMDLFVQEIAGLVPGVERVEVRTREETPQVYLVKVLTDELTIGYTTEVSLSPDQELSLEARLSNIFFLRGSVIREQLGNTGEVGERYNLDFRLKFEY